jgi:prevent-host-death family protein
VVVTSVTLSLENSSLIRGPPANAARYHITKAWQAAPLHGSRARLACRTSLRYIAVRASRERAVTKTISIEQAEECFERLVDEVEAGAEYVITREGQPVARLVPVKIGFGPLDREGLRKRGWPGSAE